MQNLEIRAEPEKIKEEITMLFLKNPPPKANSLTIKTFP